MWNQARPLLHPLPPTPTSRALRSRNACCSADRPDASTLTCKAGQDCGSPAEGSADRVRTGARGRPPVGVGEAGGHAARSPPPRDCPEVRLPAHGHAPGHAGDRRGHPAWGGPWARRCLPPGSSASSLLFAGKAGRWEKKEAQGGEPWSACAQALPPRCGRVPPAVVCLPPAWAAMTSPIGAGYHLAFPSSCKHLLIVIFSSGSAV